MADCCIKCCIISFEKSTCRRPTNIPRLSESFLGGLSALLLREIEKWLLLMLFLLQEERKTFLADVIRKKRCLSPFFLQNWKEGSKNDKRQCTGDRTGSRLKSQSSKTPTIKSSLSIQPQPELRKKSAGWLLSSTNLLDSSWTRNPKRLNFNLRSQSHIKNFRVSQLLDSKSDQSEKLKKVTWNFWAIRIGWFWIRVE